MAHMDNKNYTISDLSKEFKESKQVIRRRIDSLQIKSINRDTRKFPNEPLEYNFESYKKLAESFGVDAKDKTPDDDTQQHAKTHDDDTQQYTQHTESNANQKVVIDILERELKHAKEKLSKAEQEKEKLYQLLDQQQQLSLSDRNKMNSLELELDNLRNTKISLNEKEESPIKKENTKKKGFFSNLFNNFR